MLPRRLITALLLLPFALLLVGTIWAACNSSAPAPAAPDVVISGHLLDSAGKGVDKIRVTIWYAGGSDTIGTMNGGAFEFKLGKPSPEYTINYLHPKYGLFAVKYLYGGQSQQDIQVAFVDHDPTKVATALAASIYLSTTEEVLVRVVADKKSAPEEVVQYLKSDDFWSGVTMLSDKYGKDEDLGEVIGLQKDAIRAARSKLRDR